MCKSKFSAKMSFIPNLLPTRLRQGVEVCKPEVCKHATTFTMQTAPKYTKAMVKTQAIVTTSSIVLGPLLDNYHCLFQTLAYAHPVRLSVSIGWLHPHICTSVLTPPLFALAGFIIASGTLYLPTLGVDSSKQSDRSYCDTPHAFATIASFSALYYLSATLPLLGVGDNMTAVLLCVLAAFHWRLLDGSVSGLLMSFATAIGGPVCEAVMIAFGWHAYAHAQIWGFPFLIVPVYFAGGSAVGNLTRAVYARVR